MWYLPCLLRIDCRIIFSVVANSPGINENSEQEVTGKIYDRNRIRTCLFQLLSAHTPNALPATPYGR